MDKLKELFKHQYGFDADEILALKGDGSDRTVYRIKSKKLDTLSKSVIGVVGKNRKETEAFVKFSKHFKQHGLPVPEILAEDLENSVYLEEDLGDETLFAWMSKIRDSEGFSKKIVKMYKEVITWLPKFQIEAGQDLDYSVCYQHIEFGRESIMWDLHYFKQNFLNNFYQGKVDNQKLEKDFNQLVDFLLTEKRDYFLYRDFQSRNVMIKNSQPCFIDYQSGRKGALQYDLASLLYDAKANIPQSVREELVDYYLQKLKNYRQNIDNKKFKEYFYGFVLARIMQAFGAYGFLGFVKGKKQFLASIPFAVNNLETILAKDTIVNELSTLKEIFTNITKSEELKSFEPSSTKKLTVKIYSFGYHFSGIPQDENVRHNGGFVFDLRCLPNPGREERFRNLTGLEKPVVEFLDSIETVQNYFEHVVKLVGMTIDNYQKRNFTELMVSFGCTGGEHRSVYFAEKLKRYLERQGAKTSVKHLEI